MKESEHKLTLGSLFDGSGTMPLAAQISGIVPVWSSEIEKFPLQVTEKRFHDVKQLGDITKINGREIEPVDIIAGGSPCQSLSLAGKREGLKGVSGLFMEQIRVIKEMREGEKERLNELQDSKSIRPRYVVWENVIGAFSSNKGEDFRTVLEEFCKIKDPNANVPRPEKGKWKPAGCIMGDGYSIAWRTLDAKYWGVPQRRRRIYLVADFGGQRAPEILFKREGLSRSFAESRKAWEDITKDT